MNIVTVKAVAFDVVKQEVETIMNEGFDVCDFPRFVEGVVALEDRLEKVMATKIIEGAQRIYISDDFEQEADTNG